MSPLNLLFLFVLQCYDTVGGDLARKIVSKVTQCRQWNVKPDYTILIPFSHYADYWDVSTLG